MFGTRPEAIKLAPVLRLLGRCAEVIYTGQHYDDALGSAVLRDLALSEPDHFLEVGGQHRGRQIGMAVADLSDRYLQDRPGVVVVQGDTNAGVAGALAANSVGVPVVHVEAGLRSFDREMPEEHNRILIDHLADVCAAPTALNAENLRREGIPLERITVTGNTVVESVLQLLPDARLQSSHLEQLALRRGDYILATFHRPENVDNRAALATILEHLRASALRVVLPLHPRTRARISGFGLDSALAELHTIEPLPPSVFLSVASGAAFWVTDSGGLQEEATILKRRVLVVRRSTERPEALGSFSQLVEREDLSGHIADALAGSNDSLRGLDTPFGDGLASQRVVAAIGALVGRR